MLWSNEALALALLQPVRQCLGPGVAVLLALTPYSYVLETDAASGIDVECFSSSMWLEKVKAVRNGAR